MRIAHIAPLAFAVLTASAAVAGAQAAKATKAPAHQEKHETQAELQKEAKMTMTDARALAQKTVPAAKIQAGEIEREGGKLIYSFDMKTAGKSGIDEVNIDAMTGTLIANQHETSAAEAKESKADAKEAKAAAKEAKGDVKETKADAKADAKAKAKAKKP